MNLTKEQQEIYDGKQGATLAKVMQTLVRYGELFGADGMVPVTSKYNHLVTSFGLKALAPVYELMNQLIESGNFPPIRDHWIPMCPVLFYRILCSRISCTPSRMTTRNS